MDGRVLTRPECGIQVAWGEVPGDAARGPHPKDLSGHRSANPPEGNEQTAQPRFHVE